MATTPDVSQFSVNERPREYEATFSVTGTISVTLTADSIEEARSLAELLVGDEEFGHELDQVDCIDLSYINKTPTMYRVIRDGRAMQVSALNPGDQPRPADERGF